MTLGIVLGYHKPDCTRYSGPCRWLISATRRLAAQDQCRPLPPRGPKNPFMKESHVVDIWHPKLSEVNHTDVPHLRGIGPCLSRVVTWPSTVRKGFKGLGWCCSGCIQVGPKRKCAKQMENSMATYSGF